ncbi:MAG: dCTP deaminase [Deinococcus sp.]|nr:dCTP deaminase [Deinococcus sp.]
MLKCDRWIRDMAEQGMIEPFVEKQISQQVISFGLSSYGYDLRLSPKQFLVFERVPGEILDPKHFNRAHLRSSQLQRDSSGEYFILPAHSYGLGVAVERVAMPPNITAIAIGKSTYARCGIIANLTPVEAGFRGHLTLELSNSSAADAKIYAHEGICQLLFFEGEPCEVTYAERGGKYQDQPEEVVLARL